MKIFCVIKVSADQKLYIQQELGDHEIFFKQDMDTEVAEREMGDCEVVFGNPSLDLLEKSNNVRWVQLESVGLDPYQELIKSGKIRFSNLRGFFDQPVAETAIGGMLSLYRKLFLLQKAQEEVTWIKDQVRAEGDTIMNKNILILGAGSIGHAIGDLLIAFKSKVKFYDVFQDLSDFQDLSALDETLPEFDIVVGCLPETADTINFLNGPRLTLLKPSAIVVNVGRGSLIDEEALIDQLSSGNLGGAFLDVTRQEPLPRESPLWNVPNLLLSQHTGGGTIHEVQNKVKFCIDNFRRYLAGKHINLVAI